jgi:hypothetical protein
MLILPNGRVVGAIPLGTAGVLAALLPVGGPLTFYVRWGWLLAPLAAAAWLLAAAPLAVRAIVRRSRAWLRLVALVIVPGSIFVAEHWLNADPLRPPIVASLVALIVGLGMGRSRAFGRRRAAISLGASLLLTGFLILAMYAAYTRYGFHMRIGPPDGRWLPWVLVSVLAGTGVETWLRGAVFGAGEVAGGWPLAVLCATLAGVVIHLGAPQEILFWHLLTGLLFGAIRLWTKDAIGLGPARGLGDAVILALATLR